MFLKAVGRGTDRPGTAALGRQAARETLGKWGISADSFVMNDGSGLSRYDYVTADAIVALLKHVWQDEKLRGPFVAALPVSGYDGTLGSRMKNTPLAGRVQAKTGTISNMRALSGYLVTDSGERIVFSIIANHFTAGSAAVDEVAEKMLLQVGDEVGLRRFRVPRFRVQGSRVWFRGFDDESRGGSDGDHPGRYCRSHPRA